MSKITTHKQQQQQRRNKLFQKRHKRETLNTNSDETNRADESEPKWLREVWTWSRRSSNASVPLHENDDRLIFKDQVQDRAVRGTSEDCLDFDHGPVAQSAVAVPVNGDAQSAMVECPSQIPQDNTGRGTKMPCWWQEIGQ